MWILGSLKERGAVLGVVLLIVLSCTVIVDAQRVFTLQQAVIHKQIDVTLVNKRGGYLGDRVSIKVKNNLNYAIQVTARVGDVLLNKNCNKNCAYCDKICYQNLVVTRTLVLRIEANQWASAEGLWTACLDHDRSSPKEGDRFDIHSNVCNWATDSASKLCSLLKDIDRREEWDNDAIQGEIWEITEREDFPHPKTPYPGDGPPKYVPLILVILTWDSTADLDLWVTEPSGEKIYYKNPESNTGGMLMQDDNCKNHRQNRASGGPEEVLWQYEKVPCGIFTIEIHYNKECLSEGLTRWELIVMVDGKMKRYWGEIGPGDIILVTQIKRYCLREIEIKLPDV